MGQRLWLDNITRRLLTSRTLRLCIEEFSLTRLASNPAIFDHAIKNSRDYYDAIRQKLKIISIKIILSFLLCLKNEIKENIYVETEMQRRTRKLSQAIRDNSLSIVLFVLFVVCISAQSFAGWRLQNETLAAHGQASIGYWHFLSTGAFLEGLASNWQAAVLQLGSLIVFSSFLYQRGAPHSRDPRSAPRANAVER